MNRNQKIFTVLGLAAIGATLLYAQGRKLDTKPPEQPGQEFEKKVVLTGSRPGEASPAQITAMFGSRSLSSNYDYP